MSFCCGASMIGTKGTLRYIRTKIHHVPILFCPVCQRTEVHHLALKEYEILAEFAYGDGADEVDFEEYVDVKEPRELYVNCVNHEDEDPLTVVRSQIDMSLDLLAVAKDIGDKEWQDQLGKRLQALSRRQSKLMKKQAK